MHNSPTASSNPQPPPLRVSDSANSLHDAYNAEQQRLPLFATPVADAKNGRAHKIFKGWKLILFRSWMNILVLLIPISYILDASLEDPEAWVFSFSLLALIPMISLHELTTQELVCRMGGTMSGLINATMANIVEIVVAGTALRKCELRVVQTTMIGSMLSRIRKSLYRVAGRATKSQIVLVLGICFFAGGIRFSEQFFDQTANSMNLSMLSMAVGAILLPAVFHFALSGSEENVISASQRQSILQMSHSVSIILIVVYLAYLVFQLYSHHHLYRDQPGSTKSTAHRKTLLLRSPALFWKEKLSTTHAAAPVHEISLKETYAFASPKTAHMSSNMSPSMSDLNLGQQTKPTIRLVEPGTQAPFMAHSSHSMNCSGSTCHDSPEVAHNEMLDPGYNYRSKPNTHAQEQQGDPQLSLFLTLLLLAVVTAAVGITADRLVESLDHVSPTISKEWVGLILLPAVGSLAECASAINTSYKDQLSFSISVAIGSTIQMILFVLPFMVTIAWIMRKPLGLLFDPFESLVLYIAVQTLNHVVSDGKSNWLEGVILVGLYIIIGVSFWFYPGSALPSSLAVCHPDFPAN